MRKLLALAIASLLLTACAVPPEKSASQKKLELRCRTHATHAAMTGSPDEQMPYLECIHTKGAHDIEVIENP